MPKLEWEPEYNVGEDMIDNQHLQLVDIINLLLDAQDKGQSKESIGKALWAVLDYSKMHFAAEEKLMEEKKYPDLPGHKEAHKGLIKQALELVKKHQSGNLQSGDELVAFLKNWLITHIVHTDKKFGAYLTAL